jgi:hypothetical protein
MTAQSPIETALDTYDRSVDDFVSVIDDSYPGTAYVRRCGDLYRYVESEVPDFADSQEGVDLLVQKVQEAPNDDWWLAEDELSTAIWAAPKETITGTIGCARSGDVESVIRAAAIHCQGYDYCGSGPALVEGYGQLLPAIASAISAQAITREPTEVVAKWFDIEGYENRISVDWLAAALSPYLGDSERTDFIRRMSWPEQSLTTLVALSDAIGIDLADALSRDRIASARLAWEALLSTLHSVPEDSNDGVEMYGVLEYAYLLFYVARDIAVLDQAAGTAGIDLDSRFPWLLDWAPAELISAAAWPPQ